MTTSSQWMRLFGVLLFVVLVVILPAALLWHAIDDAFPQGMV